MKQITLSVMIVFSVSAAAGLMQAAEAQWPSDPAQNLCIADHASGEQVVPKLAATPDGGCYLGWYDNSYSGNYDVYLQRLDALGVEQWPHNGICVSSHAQNSWVTDWDLISDSQGNAIVAFNDVRGGGDWDVYVYKVSPGGAQLWGPDGQAVSGADPDDEVGPALAETTDGDVVVTWYKMDGAGVIQMQRIAPDGTWRFAGGPVTVVTAAGTERPAFADVVASLDGSVIVSYVRDISSYMSPRHFLARRFSATGAPVWASTAAIMDDSALPMGYSPTIKPDGSGGLVTSWHRSEGNHIFSLVQHINAEGAELFAHNGIRVSTDAVQHQIDPSYTYDTTTGDLYVFWNQRNDAQTRWGIYGQRVTSGGINAWGSTGLVVLPVDTIYKSYPRTLQLGHDVVLFIADEPTGVIGRDRLRAWRIDPSGQNVWSPSPVMVASTLSTKNRMPVAINPSGMGVIVWEDDRGGTPDLYGQNVYPDGRIGPPSAGVRGASRVVPASLAGMPNPAPASVRLALTLGAPLRGAALAVSDVRGRVVRRLPLGDLAPGLHDLVWDGRDRAGEMTPSGVYFVRLEGIGGPGPAVRLVRTR